MLEVVLEIIIEQIHEIIMYELIVDEIFHDEYEMEIDLNDLNDQLLLIQMVMELQILMMFVHKFMIHRKRIWIKMVLVMFVMTISMEME